MTVFVKMLKYKNKIILQGVTVVLTFKKIMKIEIRIKILMILTFFKDIKLIVTNLRVSKKNFNG